MQGSVGWSAGMSGEYEGLKRLDSGDLGRLNSRGLCQGREVDLSLGSEEG